MRKVKIAEFKSHLSEHLREVRKGRPLVILDREEPIAEVIPIRREPERLKIRPAKIKGRWEELKFTPIDIGVDIVKLLREDRDRR
ncbi:MAG: type II toxin-antitoxin system Phd/YefM family antitoxin [Deltaproteobacteria bacterium]|nr:type II toxin-antitoxin system Phd/YefM family antitoxin [Deltaproteobacteria bacterium]MBI4374429.1 type II toxin-antitoxin system Phd/YefM family antitoxin [Deltaproteobacteria bacterium]